MRTVAAGSNFAEYYDGGGMMEAIREWLLSVVFCAVFVGMLRQFVQTGVMSEIVKFAGGLVLLLALLAPIHKVELAQIELDVSSYESMLAQTQASLAAEREKAVKQSIEDKTRAYIEAKSEELGATLRAEVMVSQTEDGTWLPRQVVLYGERSQPLAQWIEGELGITQDKQEWRTGD